MADLKTRTATEASAVAALAVAVGFAFSGAWIPAAVASLVGVGLFAAYEYMEIETISLSEEQIEKIGETADEAVSDLKEEREN